MADPSQTLIQLIKRCEGCRLTGYQDIGGIWTIGYGHTPSGAGQLITQDQAEALLASDLATVSAYVHAHVKPTITPSMSDALCSFVFNIGTGAFQKSTLLQMLNNGQYLEVPAQLLRWKNVRGKPVLGLLRRRVDEAALFLKDGLPT